MKTLAIAFITVTLGGCAITQQTHPVSSATNKSVCLIENPDVRPGFLREYRNTLEAKGYIVKIIAPSASVSDCPITSTYIGRWSWDLAMYLSYAEIRVFREGTQIGDALYDATRGGGRLDKFIDAETKIRELVNQLFPHGPGMQQSTRFDLYASIPFQRVCN